MMGCRVAPEAEFDLDDIWYYLATKSGNLNVADQEVDRIARVFLLLSSNPHLGRRRDDDLLVGLRSFVAGKYVIFYRIAADDEVLILRVLQGKRDIEALF